MQERFKTFTVLIAKIGRSIRKIKTEEMGELNLKSPHVSCLYYIHKMKSLTATELCEICAEDKAVVSRSLDYLEKNGYLFCDSNLKKRYRSALTLTEKGAFAASYIAEKIDSILEQASSGLSEEKRVVLYEGISLIKSNLEKICKK